MKKFEQDYKYLYKRKVEELKVLKKALELACERLCHEDVYDAQTIPEYYILCAKEELKND